MATAELKDDATHEEIQEAVEQIVEDRKPEEKPEDKGDAQKIAEERDKPEIPTTETDSGSEDDADDTATNTGDSEGQTEWFDDDLKAEIAAFGIDEKEFADFTNREEVERALRLFNRTTMEAGRKAQADKAKGEEVEKKPEPKSEAKEGAFKPALNKDIWDDEAQADIEGQLTKMDDRYESRFSALEQHLAEAGNMVKQQQFDAAVDAMGHADLFGKTGKESAKQLERRQSLLDDSEAYLDGMRLRGRESGDYGSLVNRVARMVFADELGKKELKARTRKVSKQSDGRMGGGATRPTDPPETLREEMRRLYREKDDMPG